jgi:phytoene dehydrogenase-like protein
MDHAAPGDFPRSDAFVIGSGPNGLAAGIVLARHGIPVTVVEAADTIGGGARTAELTLPGFLHDVCSAVHPLAIGSPFLRTLPLEQHGLQWVQPDAPLAHPLDNGTAVVLERSLDETAATLGEDASAYARLFRPALKGWNTLSRDLIAPLAFPKHPLQLARFGINAIRPAYGLAKSIFETERARALFAGLAAHSMLPLENWATAAFGLVLGLAGHAVGWPIPCGGARQISDALASYLRSLGGTIVTGIFIRSLAQLPDARAVLFDTSPRVMAEIAAERLPSFYQRSLRRFRYGMGAFKVDYALSAPIPWKSPECRRAATVHLGGSLDEIAASERSAWRGVPPDRPLVLLSQPTLFDPTRAPAGKHIAWAYCHVPNGNDFDMLPRLEAQIERFAPGFRDTILARSVMTPAALENYNPNYVGGDINGGAADLRQLFTRPTLRMYTTPHCPTQAKDACVGHPDLYLCSASTPPGGGVHGMCGYYAAQVTLRQTFGLPTEVLS